MNHHQHFGLFGLLGICWSVQGLLFKVICHVIKNINDIGNRIIFDCFLFTLEISSLSLWDLYFSIKLIWGKG